MRGTIAASAIIETAINNVQATKIAMPKYEAAAS